MLTAYYAAQHQGTQTTDANGNVTYTPYGGPPSFVAGDGKTFTSPEEYRAYQTRLDATKHNELYGQAQTTAMNDAINAIKARGLNPADYLPYIQQRFNQIHSQQDPYDLNPGAAFTPNLANDVLNSVEAQKRSGYEGIVNAHYGPDYVQSAIPTSALDDTVNSILGTGYQTAEDALKRGLARGQFNQVGFDAAQSKLDTANTGEKSSLGSIANDVLNSYRDKLSGVTSSASTAASNWQLGDPGFAYDDYAKQAWNVLNQEHKYAAGDFINQVGNAPLFDIASLVSTGGQAQGSQNLPNSDVQSALEARAKANNAGRGLGSRGAF